MAASGYTTTWQWITSFPVPLLCLVLFPATRAAIDFVAEPQPRAIILGQDLTLNCSAIYRPPDAPPLGDDDVIMAEDDVTTLRYQWYFDESVVELSVIQALVFQNHSLFVPRVGTPELGSYQCAVWPAGDPDSSPVWSKAASIVQAHQDEFFIHPQSVSLAADSVTSLTCVSGWGAPPPEVRWEREGRVFTQGRQDVTKFGTVGPGGAERRSLALTFTVTTEHTGTYRCVAVNPMSGAVVQSEAAALNVSAVARMPYVTQPMRGVVVVPENVPFTLDCWIGGWPTPAVEWYHGGVYVANSTRRTYLWNGSLHFNPLQRASEGLYACIGTNTLGSVASLSTNLTVSYLDVEFAVKPRDVSTVASQRVTLSCRPPRSRPPASVVWYKDGEPVAERGGALAVAMTPEGDLVLSSVQLGDAGSYTCRAINEAAYPPSRTSQPITLTVQGSPLLVEPPLAAKVIKGDILTLRCRVSGDPAPSIAWFRNDELLLPSDTVLIKNAGQELLVTNVNKLDEGLYHCRADNIYGMTKSPPANVTVIVPPELVEGMRDVTAVEGDAATLRCRFYGDPDPLVKWFKDGDLLETAQTTKYLATSRDLTVLAVSRGDAGEYRCQATNEGGAKESRGRLHVQVRPYFVSGPYDVTVNLSQPLIFHCDALGDPLPSVSWRFNVSNVTPVGVETSDDVKTLIIAAVRPHHAGVYTCRAHSTVGEASRSGTVIVQEPPQIVHVAGETTINLSGTLELRCDVTGVPLPDVRWFYESFPIRPTLDNRVTFPDRHTLRILFVSPQDAGVYVCLAVNPAGRVSRQVQVLVVETPLPPVLTAVVPVSMFSVNVTWQPTSQSDHVPVDGYVVQYKQRIALDYLLDDTDIRAPATWSEVGGLRPDTDYVFRVAAKNHVGTGQYSAVRGATTLKTAPGPPRNFRLLSQNAVSLLLQWEVPGLTNGVVALYQLQYRRKFSQEAFDSVDISRPTLPRQQFDLTGLRPYTTYIVRARAANLEGATRLWGQFSPELEVSTSMAVPSQGPVPVLLRVDVLRSVHVTWQPIPDTYSHGPLLGYIVRYKEMADSNQEWTELTLASVTVETTLDNLLPWRYYEVQVAGYNGAGTGVFSLTQSVRTLPEAPTGTPREVGVEAVSDTEVSLTWQPVAYEERNCEISGYLVWYENEATGESESVYVASPSTLYTVIRGLQPWTVYLVRVQAFTTQVTEGFGPLTDARPVRTLDSVPGKVVTLTVETFKRRIVLAWQPPDEPNGVLSGYVLYVEQLSDVTAGPRVRRRRRRSTLEFGGGQRLYELSSRETSVELTGLQPGGEGYRLALAARTARGLGPFFNVTATTRPVDWVDPGGTADPSTPAEDATTPPLTTQGDPSPPLTSPDPRPPSDAPTVGGEEVTQAQGGIDKDVQPPDGAAPQGLSEGALLGVVLGTVLGGLLVATLLVLVVLLCCRRLRRDSDTDSSPDGLTDSSPDSSSSQSSTPRRRKSSQRRSGTNMRYHSNDKGGDTSSNTEYPRTSGESSLESSRENPLSQRNDAAGKRDPSLIDRVNSHSRGRSRRAPSSLENNAPSVAAPLSVPRALPVVRRTASSKHRAAAHHVRKPEVFTVTYPQGQGLPFRDTHPAGTGIENQGFDSEYFNRSTTLDSPTVNTIHWPPTTQSRGPRPPKVKVRRSRRLQSRAASAIAAQRDRETSVFADLPDTDALIQGDSVVVYNERTAV